VIKHSIKNEEDDEDDKERDHIRSIREIGGGQ
jgi:hypothetical protein